MSDIIDDIDNLARDERDLRCEPNGSRWLKTYELLCAELVKHWPAFSTKLRSVDETANELDSNLRELVEKQVAIDEAMKAYILSSETSRTADLMASRLREHTTKDDSVEKARSTLLASLAEKQRAIKEAFATLDAGHGMLACRDASHILRPHATEATEGQIRTAAHYTRAEAKANVDAIINKVTEAKQPRQWTSTPPKDRSRKWWNAYGVSAAHAHYRHIIPDECSWDNATHLVAESDYDLWLPWQEGDTADNLPPLPTEATPVTTQPTAGVTPVGSGTTPQASPVGNDDTRELVARLAEAIARYFDDGEETVINLINRVRDIENAARRGGGA